MSAATAGSLIDAITEIRRDAGDFRATGHRDGDTLRGDGRVADSHADGELVPGDEGDLGGLAAVPDADSTRLR
jgi:hypothetical protein